MNRVTEAIKIINDRNEMIGKPAMRAPVDRLVRSLCNWWVIGQPGKLANDKRVNQALTGEAEYPQSMAIIVFNKIANLITDINTGTIATRDQLYARHVADMTVMATRYNWCAVGVNRHMAATWPVIKNIPSWRRDITGNPMPRGFHRADGTPLVRVGFSPCDYSHRCPCGCQCDPAKCVQSSSVTWGIERNFDALGHYVEMACLSHDTSRRLVTCNWCRGQWDAGYDPTSALGFIEWRENGAVILPDGTTIPRCPEAQK